MLLPLVLGHYHVRIDRPAEIRKWLDAAPLDFLEFPTTLSQDFQGRRS
jgi:hypothetical protein